MRALALALALLVASLPLRAEGPASPRDALARMGEALSRHSFDGLLVYSRDGQLDALRVRHVAASGQELIERLTGPAMPLSRSADGVRLGAADLVGFPTATDGIRATLTPERHYRLERVSEDRVAGREAEVLDLRAADGLRFSRRYWVDLETGLLLRAAVYAGDGSLVEQWMFVSLALEASIAEPEAPAAAPRTLRGPRAEDIARTRLQVVDPPPGFALVAAAVEGNEEHLVFSDGLARVSVFAQPLGDQAAVLSGHQKRGALAVFGRVYRGLQVVVVGEVPGATAERFAQSVDALRGG